MNGLKLAVLAQISGSISTDNDLATIAGKLDTTSRIDFSMGAGARQANLVFADRRTLAASATEDLDLDGGLADPFGGALVFKRVKAILIQAAAGNANDVIIGGAASNGFVGPFGAATHTMAVKPGGILLIAAPTAAGWPVTASTADLLKVANSGGGTGVTYDVILLGAAQ